MAQDFQTSFIPTGKQGSMPTSMIPGGSRAPKKDFLGKILFIVTLLIFIGTAISTGYTIWYEDSLEKQIDTLEQELLVIQAAVVDGEVDVIERMNNRLTQSNRLLSNHLAPLLLLEILEEDTLPTITFQNFIFEADGQNLQVTAGGEAANFESIVYQSDVYGENPAFKDVLFSNLQRTPEGNVTFSFSTFLNKENILYTSRDFSVFDTPSEGDDEAVPVVENTDVLEDSNSEDDLAEEEESDIPITQQDSPAVTRITPEVTNNEQ